MRCNPPPPSALLGVPLPHSQWSHLPELSGFGQVLNLLMPVSAFEKKGEEGTCLAEGLLGLNQTMFVQCPHTGVSVRTALPPSPFFFSA